MAFLALLPLFLAPLPPAAAGDWPQWRGSGNDGVSGETGWAPAGTAAWRAHVGLGHSSPSIAAGRLYTLGFDEEAEEDVLWCLDAGTGEELWTFRHPGRLRAQDHTGGTLTTPAVAGDRVFATSREGEVRCLDAATGELLWVRDLGTELEVDPGPYGFGGSPLVRGDGVLVGFGHVALLDGATGETRWISENVDVRYSTSTPLTIGGRELLAVFAEPELCLLDLADGTRLAGFPWRPQPRGLNASSPIGVGERVFVSSAYERGCALLELAGEELGAVWQNKNMRNKMAGGVLAGGRLFGFDESMLKCLDPETGEEVWRKRGLGTGALAAAGGRLILTTSRGELVVADASADEYLELSRERVIDGGTFWTPPVLADGRIYVRSGLGELVCRDHRAPAAVARSRTGEPEGDELPGAGELFERHLAAIGGREAVLAHTSLTRRGTFAMRSVGFPPVSLEIQHHEPDLWRARIKLPGGREGYLTRVFDGEAAYEVNPYLGDKLYPADVTREYRDTSLLHEAAQHAGLYRSRRTVGRTEFGDRDCWQVACVARSGAERSVYFSVETGLLVGRDGPTESMVIYDDWQEHGGVLIPMLEKHFVQDTGIEETWRFEEVLLDGVDPALWERPEPIQALLDASAQEGAATR